MKGLESALQGVFKKTTDEFAKQLATAAVVALGGAPDPANFTGGKDDPAYKDALAKSNENAAHVANAALIAGAGIENAIQNGTKETVAQMAVSAVAVGYSVALALASTGYGAIAGVVVGAATFLASLFSPSDNTGKYYQHIDIANNQVNFNPEPLSQVPGSGYTKDQATATFQEIQKTIDTFYNGWTDLIFHFANGAALIGDMTKINGTELQDAWNHAASHGFNDAMDAWIKTGLPGMIEDNVWKPIAEGLTGIGFSSAAIAGIRAAADRMVPADALKYVTSLVENVMAMQDELAKLAVNVTGDDPFG